MKLINFVTKIVKSIKKICFQSEDNIYGENSDDFKNNMIKNTKNFY